MFNQISYHAYYTIYITATLRKWVRIYLAVVSFGVGFSQVLPFLTPWRHGCVLECVVVSREMKGGLCVVSHDAMFTNEIF